MNPKELVLNEVEKLHQELKLKLQTAKRVALSEAWKVLQLVTASTVRVIETIASNLEGKEKKAIAIEYINNFYDKVFFVVDIPFVPNFVEPIIHKYVKQILMIMVGASIDATVTIFRETGVFLKKGNS
jgi:hypothetical protein